jgi:hypothetical protein
MKSHRGTWRRSLFAVALLAGALGIAARRAPAGHVNKVTPEAKAALDKYAQIVYRPAEHGLKLATGTIAVDGDQPRPSIKFSFSPERKVKVEWTDAGKARKLPEPVLGMVDMVLEGAFLGVPIPDKTEYDAELFHGPSGDDLKISCFTDSVVKSQLRVSLDEHGLARSVVMSTPPPADHNQPAPTPVTLVLGWGKTDEGYRIEQISFPGIGATAFGGMKWRSATRRSASTRSRPRGRSKPRSEAKCA